MATEEGEDVMHDWDTHKNKVNPGPRSSRDGVPRAVPSLALASKGMGKAEKAGILEKQSERVVPMQSEDELGKLLLAIVASARAVGLDPERALREATRELQVEIRASELAEATDAGVVGLADN